MKRDEKAFMESFKTGFSYPWGKPSRMWIALLLLIPIFGWLALAGYSKKVVRDLVKGNTTELPKFGRFWFNFKEGFFVLLFLIPSMAAVMLLNIVPLVGFALSFLSCLFLLPWLVANFLVKETFDSLWEFKKAFRIVSNNFVEYIFMMLNTFVNQIVYLLLSFIIIGIPGLLFAKNFFLAEFYRNHN